MENNQKNLGKSNDGLEGLKSLLLRYKRVNLAILGVVGAIAIAILIAVLTRELIELSLNPSRKCLDCHKAKEAKYVHLPYKQAQCLSCHTRHRKGQKSELKAPLKKLCLTCHGSIGEEMRLHFSHLPVEKGRCLECHENHVSNHKNLLVEKSEDLCIACHRIAEELEMSDTHEPFELRQCLSCHVAHGSVFDKGLRDSQKELCVICHIDIAKAEVKTVQHLPFENGRCTDCHGGHATNHDSQLVKARPDLCYICHPTIEPYFRKASRHPATAGAALTCSSCHNPHADNYKNLLASQGPNLCFTCHGDKKAFYVPSAHNEVIRRGGVGLCQNCHQVHGSDYRPLLIKDSISICKDCHPDWAHEKTSHPVGEGYTDELMGTRLTCSSSCHNPHGTRYRNMLEQVPDGLCLKCHKASELP